MMWQSAEQFRGTLRDGIEHNLLPLTRVETTHGFVMGALKKTRADAGGNYGYVSRLTFAGLRPDGTFVLEEHVHQPVLTTRALMVVTQCKWHCNGYIIDDNITHRPTNLAYSLAAVFDGGFTRTKERGMFNIVNEAYATLTSAQPRNDLFHPGNIDAQDEALQMLAHDHTLMEPAFVEAIGMLPPSTKDRASG